MNGFLKCKHGHFYKDDLEECPYCPGSKKTNQSVNTSTDFDKTRISTDSNNEFDSSKTAIFNTSKADDSLDKTQLVTPKQASNYQKPTPQPAPFSKPQAPNQHVEHPQADYANPIVENQHLSTSQHDLSRTSIKGVTNTTNSDASIRQTSYSDVSRRLVGWLVSYTINPLGVDYKLYEGMNSIGRDLINTVSVQNDTQISGKHMQILYKKGKFYAKDEMTVNGTFLNGEELEIDQIYPLKDGDKINVGDTEFIFKSCE